MNKWLYLDTDDGFYRFPDTAQYDSGMVRGQRLYYDNGNWYWSTNSNTVHYLKNVQSKQISIPPELYLAVVEASLNE